MAYSHVGHDCTVGNHVVLANGACLGGHVSVGERAFLSAAVAVHQFCRIGRLCMVSGLAGVNMDCLPFTMVTGPPARVVGLNKVGLKRAGMDPEAIADLKRAFQRLFTERAPRARPWRRSRSSHPRWCGSGWSSSRARRAVSRDSALERRRAPSLSARSKTGHDRWAMIVMGHDRNGLSMEIAA